MAKIKAFYLKPGESGEFIEFENKLEEFQRLVGGYIQCIHLTDEIDIILDDEGKLKGYEPNRVWLYEGKPIDIFVGNILFVRHDGDRFASIKEEDVSVIKEYCRVLVVFLGDLFILGTADETDVEVFTIGNED